MLKKTGFVERRVNGLVNPTDYVTMLKKTGFVERRVNGLVNPTDYVTMLKKTGFVERRVNGLVNPTDLRISFKIGLKYTEVPVYNYLYLCSA